MNLNAKQRRQLRRSMHRGMVRVISRDFGMVTTVWKDREMWARPGTGELWIGARSPAPTRSR